MGKHFARERYNYVYSKWWPHVGKLRVVKKKTTGELRMIISSEGFYSDYSSMTDSRLLDVFVWIGRYLALKGKLPRHLSLDEIAVGAQRTSRAIREVVAVEVFDKNKRRVPAPSPRVEKSEE